MTKQNNTQTQSILRLLAAALLLSLCSLPVTAFTGQEDDDEVRRTRDERRFQDARAGKRPSPQSAPPPRAQKPGANKPEAAAATVSELIGVTFWRLSPAAEERRSLSSAKDEQDDTRLLIPDRGGVKPYHAARVNDSATFSNGALLWLGIEVPRVEGCYVYVIDREEYADGSLGDPYLIFPAPTTPADANVASAGRIVYVPAPGDPLPYFRLERSSPQHVAERLTIIVSPSRLDFKGELEELAPGVKLLRLDTAEVAKCGREWGGKTRRLAARSGDGQALSLAEKEEHERRKLVPSAGKEGGEPRRLVPTDLLPQTIYEVEARSGKPVLVNVSLRIAQ